MKQLNELTSCARELLQFTPLQYMLDAVKENPSLAEIYVDDEMNPSLCILLLGNYLFMGGQLTASLSQDLIHILLKEDQRKDLSLLIVFYEDKAMCEPFEKTFSRFYNSQRSLYVTKPSIKPNVQIPDTIIPITTQLLKSNLKNLGLIIKEVVGTATYEDMNDFCTRGIGYTMVIDHSVYGFCTSEYPSQHALGIGIEVDEKYHKQGYATAMTKAFLAKAATQNYTVYWECWHQNLGSVRTALACGFKKIADYPVLIVELNS